LHKKSRRYTITEKIYIIQILDPDTSLSETLHPGISIQAGGRDGREPY
jgi:hypothetical protein